ncbi:glycosyl transferase [Clostridia bacterium]|nr:glycosyl transferase [Clostridia bacterium]
MITISLCMIVRDEEETLARCLECAKAFADEIIIVDTGSVDSTVEIAKNYTDKVFEFKWVDDFSKARNFSFSHATMDYQMWLDADDIISEQDQQAISELKNTLEPDIDMVYMQYKVSELNYSRERLIKNIKALQRWNGAIHECIAPVGNIIYADITITHAKVKQTAPDRNLNIFKKMLERGEHLVPREQYYYARELMWVGRNDEATALMETLIKRTDVWIENRISACLDLYNMTKNASFLYKSFELATPRAEICYELGNYYLSTNEYKRAIWWYESALKCTPSNGGFNVTDCYGFNPYLQLCICYDKLGDKQTAIEYNKKAEAIKPDHPSVVFNNNYFL